MLTGPVRSATPFRKTATFTGSVRADRIVTLPSEPTGGPNAARSQVTVTGKAARATLPDPSVAVQRTVVTPTGNVEPEAGAQATLGEASTTSPAEGVG